MTRHFSLEIFQMKNSLHISKFLKVAGLALLVHATGASAASTYTPEAASYRNGGIGVDGRQAMHAERQQYNLHLHFTQAKSGEYLSGVIVTITPQPPKGAPLHIDDAGPWLYARLQPGSYRITAEFECHKQVRTVEVDKAASEVILHWR
jgi:hypothetical protein